MTKKSKRKSDDPEQSKRFKEAARKAEADESPGVFRQLLKRVAKQSK